MGMTLKVSMIMLALKTCLPLKVMPRTPLVWKKWIKKKCFVAISRIFFLPQIFDEKKSKQTLFYKRDLIQIIVCLFQQLQQPKIDTLYVTHSAIFFLPYLCLILQKIIIRKKHFLFVCQICVNKNQRPL